MSFLALVKNFSTDEDMPVMVDSVLDWVRANTDHNDIRLYPVHRKRKAARGACRRKTIPKAGAPLYSSEVEIITQILFGEDLSEDWQRLVIVKELLHVFDPIGERVSTPDGVRKLITAMVAPEIRGTPFIPAMNDQLGAFKAMAILLPRAARIKLASAAEQGSRTVSEIAAFVKLPEHYVDIWLRLGDDIEKVICGG